MSKLLLNFTKSSLSYTSRTNLCHNKFQTVAIATLAREDFNKTLSADKVRFLKSRVAKCDYRASSYSTNTFPNPDESLSKENKTPEVLYQVTNQSAYFQQNI